MFVHLLLLLLLIVLSHLMDAAFSDRHKFQMDFQFGNKYQFVYEIRVRNAIRCITTHRDIERYIHTEHASSLQYTTDMQASRAASGE